MKSYIPFLVSCAVVLLVVLPGRLPGTCAYPSPTLPSMGSHGYRTWIAPDYISVIADDRTLCVPEGYGALGHTLLSVGSATFASGSTAVFFKKDAFSSVSVPIQGGAYAPTLIYPNETSEQHLARYITFVKRSFSRVARLYDSQKPQEEHTVLVTAGVADVRLYPDPKETLTIAVLPPSEIRSGQLLTHAVTHLYNREQNPSYPFSQSPFPPEEFREMEASWAELVYGDTYSRDTRFAYLYNVHTAVVTKNFSLIQEPPFNDEAAFAQMKGTLLVEEPGTYVDYQYSHYVLAPLMLLAIDGLLEIRNQDASVESLLIQVHKNNLNFFAELSLLLTQDDMAHILSWMHGDAVIPRDYAEAALYRYTANDALTLP